MLTLIAKIQNGRENTKVSQNYTGNLCERHDILKELLKKEIDHMHVVTSLIT